MNVKWFIFSLLFAVLLPSGLYAQAADTIVIIKHDTVWPASNRDVLHSEPAFSRYDRRVYRYRRYWDALIPTHTKIQFAGNMGLLSFGTGWDYGKRNQWETDIFVGFLPKYDSERMKITFTLKQNYIPWNFQLCKSAFAVEPLTCGMYFNTVFGGEFWNSEPSRYSKGYYSFSSKVRIHAFLGQRLVYDIPPRWRFSARSITLFYELSTSDLYLISAITNSYLRPRDYLSLSFGIKLQLL